MKFVKLLTIFMASLITLTGCAYTTLHGVGEKSAIDFRSLKYPVDDKFNFILAYGNYGKDMINTFEGYVVKDLVTEQIKANIQLTDGEMDSLYNYLEKFKFEEFPNNYYHVDEGFAGMDSRIYFYINYKGLNKIQTICPIDFYSSSNSYTDALWRFYQKSTLMIKQNKDYKKLPKPKGFYR